MANEENLIPNSERTPSERRENARKGGIASGKARRRKANLKKTLETLLTLEIPNYKLKEQLEALGLDPTMEQGLVFSVLLKAIERGDIGALHTIAKLTGQDKSLADRQEQRARIDKMKIEAAQLQGDDKAEAEDDGFLAALKGKGQDVWQDETAEETD